MMKRHYWFLVIWIGIKNIATFLWIPFLGFDIPAIGIFSFVYGVAVAYGSPYGSFFYSCFLIFLLIGVPVLWIVCYFLFLIHPILKKGKKVIQAISCGGLILLNAVDVLCCVLSILNNSDALGGKYACLIFSVVLILLLVLYWYFFKKHLRQTCSQNCKTK